MCLCVQITVLYHYMQNKMLIVTVYDVDWVYFNLFNDFNKMIEKMTKSSKGQICPFRAERVNQYGQ